MPSLIYSATFGNQVRTVKILEVQGSWHVYVDKGYMGAVHLMAGGLMMAPSRFSGLQGDDIAAILDVVAGLGEEPEPAD